MKLTPEKTQELLKNPEFIERLSESLDNCEQFISLFKEYDIEVSEKDYEEILESKKDLLACSEEELNEIAGGWSVSVKWKPRHRYYDSKPMSAAGALTIGGFLTAGGIALMAAAINSIAKKGPRRPI